MTALKPCPFCGGEASDEGRITYSRPLADTWWSDGSSITEAFYVNCMKCGTTSRGGVIPGYRTKAEAIEKWNTRASEARLAQLEGALNAILKVRVHGWENIWAGSNRCKDIARQALTSAGEG